MHIDCGKGHGWRSLPCMKAAEERSMYYVLQVLTGKEEIAIALIENIVSPEIYEQCFSLKRHMRKKIGGKWKDIHEKLLPGYVFIRTDNPAVLYEKLRRVPALTKLLGRECEREQSFFAALSERDETWLGKLTGSTDSIGSEVGLSQVDFDINDEIRIVSGPLADMKGMIKKINLHRRMAEVEMEFMNQKSVVFLGIELVEKV